jgi:hypothetical protein
LLDRGRKYILYGKEKRPAGETSKGECPFSTNGWCTLIEVALLEKKQQAVIFYELKRSTMTVFS